MALTNKLTDIADAIRNKTGKTDLLTLEQMPIEIESIQGGGGSDSTFTALMNGETTVFHDSGITKIKDYTFYGGNNALQRYMTEVDLPNLITIGNYGFYYQSKIKNVNFPKVETIGQYGLCYNLNLQELKLPSIVTLNNYSIFTNDASANKTVITKIDLGDKLTSIGSNAMSYHPQLTAIIIRATTPPTLSNSNAFTGSAAIKSGGGIYVPAAAVDAYKKATNWSTWKNYIFAIEDYPEICGEVA